MATPHPPMSQLLQAVGASSVSDPLEQLKAALSAGQVQGASFKRARVEELAASAEQQGLGRWHHSGAPPPPPPPALLSGNGGQGFHNSGSESPEGEDDSAMQRTGSGPADRTQATKDKNRKAQQRFRLRQKEKMQAMEAENVRLRALLAEHAIPLPPPPAALLSGGGGTGGGGEAGAAPRSAPGPASVSAMYDEVEGVLDATPGISPRALVSYLQAWARDLTDDQKAVHRHTLLKWHECGAAERVRMWVEAATRPGPEARPGEGQGSPAASAEGGATTAAGPPPGLISGLVAAAGGPRGRAVPRATDDAPLEEGGAALRVGLPGAA
ncbi:hypothetical protein ACKKBF_B04485 [Auxenochlorella protothecoides x Auxenochlorella symbiontica]